MRTILKSVLVALAVGCLAGAAAPALAQGAAPAAAKAGMTEDWLIGEWHAAQESASTYVDSYGSATTTRMQYWLDLKIYRRADGKLEALSTVRQMADPDETSSWKSDIAIKGDMVFITPRELVGKPEWKSYQPDNYELRRLENRLVGRLWSKWWIFENGHLVQFMR